jgi:hypothetical protein
VVHPGRRPDQIGGHGDHRESGAAVCDELFELVPTLQVSQRPEILAVVAKEVEGDQGRGELNPPGSQAPLQGLEVDPGAGHHHELAVDSGPRWQALGQQLDDVGECRLQCAGVMGVGEAGDPLCGGGFDLTPVRRDCRGNIDPR